jgi:hypothetical protein
MQQIPSLVTVSYCVQLSLCPLCTILSCLVSGYVNCSQFVPASSVQCKSEMLPYTQDSLLSVSLVVLAFKVGAHGHTMFCLKKDKGVSDCNKLIYCSGTDKSKDIY